MKRLKLEEFTTSAEGGCVYCTKTEAAMRFMQLGMTGITYLCDVKDIKGRHFTLWINMMGEDICFLPLFIDDMELNDLCFADISPIIETAFIYHKRDEESGVSYLAIVEKDEIVIRQLRIFLDQNMVENYCATQQIKPTGIYLCQMRTVHNDEYVATCWSIEYENPNELDENEEPQLYETLLPVDLADSDILQKVGIPNINNVYLHSGDVFRAQGVMYRALKDENGKFFLTRDLFTTPESDSREEKNEKPATKAKGCKIVFLNRK